MPVLLREIVATRSFSTGFKPMLPTLMQAFLLLLDNLYLARFPLYTHSLHASLIASTLLDHTTFFLLWDVNLARTNPFSFPYDLISALRTDNELYVGTCAHEANTKEYNHVSGKHVWLQKHRRQILILVSK